jgi:hypothetical protein
MLVICTMARIRDVSRCRIVCMFVEIVEVRNMFRQASVGASVISIALTIHHSWLVLLDSEHDQSGLLVLLDIERNQSGMRVLLLRFLRVSQVPS